ncbi:MAG: DUF1398 family protein [Acinetobacter tandoii]|uniref:DUF1398 family protein n=1 Tax=Acinetobacter tandoii TaxID=202954 RepID=UPI003D6C51C5
MNGFFHVAKVFIRPIVGLSFFLIQALRADQAGHTSFPEFLQAIWSAGIIRYTVNLEARYVVYYGSSDESYMEKYLAVTLPI